MISCCAITGCADSSSNKDTSSASSSASDSSSSSAADSSSSDSSEQKKANAIGYDVKNSKRLYDSLKEAYAEKGYDLSMKSTANMGSELRLCVKGEKVYSTNKNSSSNKTMIFKGGNTAEIFDHTSKLYTDQKVDDAKKFVAKSDLLFGMTGDFIKATIDEQNDVINEYYKVKSDVAGSEGTICYCFRGFNGSFAQITLEYTGADFPIIFGVTEIKVCDEKVFDSKEVFNYKKEQ